MADLKTTYQDDVLDTSVNEKRKYNMIQNADGTVSFEDVTTYSQVGDSFGAADINATNEMLEKVNSNLMTSDNVPFRFGKDENGDYGYILSEGGEDMVIPFGGTNRNWICRVLCTATATHTGSISGGNPIKIEVNKYYDIKCINGVVSVEFVSGNDASVNTGDIRGVVKNTVSISVISLEYL